MRWLAVAVVVALAGCINDFDRVLQNDMRIHDIDVSAPEVRSGAIDLVIDVSLDNRMARSGEVVVEVRAFDTATGLLSQTTSQEVGRIGKDKTEVVSLPMTVPRAPGYRIEVRVEQDGRIQEVRAVTLRNLDALEANVFDTGLRVSSMDFLVRNVTADRVAITAEVHVINEGTSPSPELRMQTKAREVSTSLIADEAWVELGSIHPEETHIESVDLDVPDAFNYQVETVVWDGQVIVERGQGNVQLLPTFERPKDTEIEVVDPDVSQFARDSADRDEPRTPGFPLIAAVAAIGGIAWMKRRK